MKFKVFVIVTSLLLIGSCKKEKNRICDVYEGNVGYTVGTIDSYYTGFFRAVYKYSYTVDGYKYLEKEKAFGIGQLNERLLGQSFIVIFNVDKPSESDLNMQHGVKSEDDFISFVNEYEDAPPSPDFPDNCD